ncbi:FAD-binding oxidoreductase [Leptolyngbya sp. NK1-12]|uniref:FAD-binding oxidoreductase n=1 Tax=Leptolyngbya sp. NK1-12 TaxID=2547451 RepID=A0AA96W890_9CYAN|nr:FAD-binding oxidoreductase [Leptolyngbya sp. NK1-12]WNZ21562.1 FAD-binding oxidoreductase [Leptolyngbya sp. NK1-12]
MTTDWIVVGNGLAGAALSYELQKSGFSVLLLDQSNHPENGTRYSYGGIAYWSGTTALMQQLCQEGITLHRQLSAELESDTQFRELDLLMTVAPEDDPTAVATTYTKVAIPPVILDAQTAAEREPLLNQSAIAGALRFPHGHVSPSATVAAYNQAFLRLGGLIEIAPVIGWIEQNQRIQGVKTPTAAHAAANVVICAGAYTRPLLRSAGFSTRIYFTHAELIEATAVDISLQALVMPAKLQRFEMEAKASAPETDVLWDQPGQEVVPAILDAGVVQFRDGRLLIGQVSRTLTDLEATIDAAASEAALRRTIGQLLPALESVPGEWRSCRVAFSGDRLPLVGAVPNRDGLHVFTGFSNPFSILPPLARRFAQAATGLSKAIPPQLLPNRFC